MENIYKEDNKYKFIIVGYYLVIKIQSLVDIYIHILIR